MNDLQPISLNTEYQPPVHTTESTVSDLLGGFRRRKLVVLSIVALSLLVSVGVSAFMHKMWKAEVQLILIQRPPQDKPVEDPTYSAPLPESADTQVSMLQSPSMAERTQQWYVNQSLQTGEPVPAEVSDSGQFVKDVTVTNPKNSDLIFLDVDAPSRDLSISIANAVALAFVEWKKELAQQDIRETEAQLETEVADAKARMDAATNAEFAYRTQHHIVNVASQETNDLSIYQQDQLNVTGVQQDLASQQAQLATLSNQLSQANSSLRNGGGVRDETLVTALQSQLSQEEIARSAEAQKVTPLYPGQLPLMDAQIADLKSRLSKAINATVDNNMPSLTSQGTLLTNYKQGQVAVAFDEAKLASAIAMRNQAQAVLNSMPSLDTNVSRLDLDVQTTTQRYTLLETALNTARLQINTTTGNVQITQGAVADTFPYKPNWSMNIVLGLILGIVFAIAAVITLEQTDRRVQDVEQIERYKLGPILGVLPPLDRNAISAVAEGLSTAALSEHFSVVKTNLLGVLAQIQHVNGQVVLVTSAVNGEGKSLILAELARTLTDSGKRVIVVDANLRAPSLTRFFPTNQEEGLSNVLLEQAAFDDVVTTIDPSLAILHSGPVPDEPTRLVSSAPFLNLIHSLRARADVVLIDSSSCEVADPLLIAPHVDYVVQVVGANKGSEQGVHGSLSALAAVSYVGIIVNYANLDQVAPYQLVNAAAKVAFSQNGEPQPLAGQIRLASPDHQITTKGTRNPTHGDIVPVSTIIGEKR